MRLCPKIVGEKDKLMEKFDSITHFLLSGEFTYDIFDMGRKVMPLSNQLFESIENQTEKYPFPLQNKAWLALLLQKKGASDPVIWFLQFPIDEMGFLKQDARDGFLIGLLEQAGKNIHAKQLGHESFDELNESPYAFKPQPDRLAFFHALVTHHLDKKPSPYYDEVRNYLSDKNSYEEWPLLGLQGIADVVVRLNQSNNQALLTEAFSELPDEPLMSFCQALENSNIEGLLADAVINRLYKALDASDCNEQLVSMLVRAVSAVSSEKKRQEAIDKVLHSSFGKGIEVLAAISARSWKDLFSLPLLELFVNNLTSQSQVAFNAIMSDLMRIPSLRDLVLLVVRKPERSEELAIKLTGFMGSLV